MDELLPDKTWWQIAHRSAEAIKDEKERARRQRRNKIDQWHQRKVLFRTHAIKTDAMVVYIYKDPLRSGGWQGEYDAITTGALGTWEFTEKTNVFPSEELFAKVTLALLSVGVS